MILVYRYIEKLQKNCESFKSMFLLKFIFFIKYILIKTYIFL